LASEAAVERRAIVQVAEGQFWITGGGQPLTVDAGDLDQLMILDEVPAAVPVLTGAFEGPVEVRAAARDTEPTLGDEWDEIVEFTITTADGLSVVELYGEPRLTITDGAGSFRLRLSSRGRAAGQARHSSGRRSKILEHLLLEAWPSPPRPPKVLRAIEPPPRQTSVVLEFADAGRQGAAQIGLDLRGKPGSRALSGERGTMRLDYRFPVPRGKLFGVCAWNVIDLWATPRHDDEIVGINGLSPELAIHGGGRIFWNEIESVRPRSRTYTWDWRVPGYPGQEVWENMTSFLNPPSTVQLDLREHKNPDIGVSTTLTVEQSGLPIEWINDMTAFWRWRLERLDKATTLRGYPPPPVA
jgi:hypothetical protein